MALVRDVFDLPKPKSGSKEEENCEAAASISERKSNLKTLWEKLRSLATDIVALVRDVFDWPPKSGSKEDEEKAAASILDKKTELKTEVDDIEAHEDTRLPNCCSLLACALALLGEAVVKCPDQEEGKCKSIIQGAFVATFDDIRQKGMCNFGTMPAETPW